MRLIADGVVDREGVDGLAAPGRLHAAPPDPAAHRRARRRPARAGPGPARPDRAGAHRDHRPRLRRRRLRGRVLQRPAVQRHGPRGLRRHARPSCAAARGGARRPGHGDACGWPCGRRSPGGRCSTSSPSTSVPGVEVGRRRAGTPAPSTCRTAPARSGSSSPTRRPPGRPRSSPPTFRLHDLRDTVGRGRARRRLLDADCDPVAVDDQFAGDPVIGPLVRRDPRPAGARPGRRRRDRGPHRARPAGQRRRCAHGHRPARRGARHAGRDRTSRA